ncbi:MAG: hypothetical protein AAGH99_03230 [Planctomycetota bacterium]
MSSLNVSEQLNDLGNTPSASEKAASGGGGALRAIVWKEWRESAKWGVAGLLAVAGTLTFGLYHESDAGGHTGLQSDEVLGFYAVACGAVGLLLGVMSWAFDVTPDRWGLLLHRPATRGQWWLGKVGVNLGVYAAATLVPWFLAGWWCSVPGNVGGPWYPEMLWPGVVNAAGGGLMYFAGMLTVVRRARWWASRGVWLLTAGLGATLVATLPELFWTLLSLAAGWLLLGYVSWAHFAARACGQLGLREQVSSSLGIFAGVMVTAVLLIALFFAVFFGPTEQSIHTEEKYFVTNNGDVVVGTFEDSHGNLIAVRDLQGGTIPNPDNEAETWSWKDQNGLTATNDIFRPAKNNLRRGSEDWRLFSDLYAPVYPYLHRGGGYENEVFVIGDRDPSEWYLDRRTNLFLEFNEKTSGFVGWMSPQGYVPADQAEPAGFKGPIRKDDSGFVQAFVTPYEIFVFDGWTRDLMFIDRAAIPSGYAEAASVRVMDATPLKFAMIIDGRFVRRDFPHEIREDARGVTTIDLPFAEDQDDWASAWVYDPSEADQFVVMYWPKVQYDGYESDEVLVVRRSAAGEELERFTLPVLSDGGWTPDDMGWPASVLVTALTPFGLIIWAYGTAVQEYGWGYATWTMNIFSFSFEALLAVLVSIGLLFGGLSIYQARRAGLPRGQVLWWAFAGFFGGLAGWVTLRCSYRWGELRSASAQQAAPEADGTEVWDTQAG